MSDQNEGPLAKQAWELSRAVTQKPHLPLLTTK